MKNTAVSFRLNLNGQSSVSHSYSTCSASIDFTAWDSISVLDYKSFENMTYVPVVSFWTHCYTCTVKGCYLISRLALNMAHHITKKLLRWKALMCTMYRANEWDSYCLDLFSHVVCRCFYFCWLSVCMNFFCRIVQFVYLLLVWHSFVN